MKIEDYNFWKRDPVTQHIFKHLKVIKDDFTHMIITSEITTENIPSLNKLAGTVNLCSFFLEGEVEDLFEKPNEEGRK